MSNKYKVYKVLREKFPNIFTKELKEVPVYFNEVDNIPRPRCIVQRLNIHKSYYYSIDEFMSDLRHIISEKIICRNWVETEKTEYDDYDNYPFPVWEKYSNYDQPSHRLRYVIETETSNPNFDEQYTEYLKSHEEWLRKIKHNNEVRKLRKENIDYNNNLLSEIRRNYKNYWSMASRYIETQSDLED